MHKKSCHLSNFAKNLHTRSICVRPDNEEQLNDFLAENKSKILARGHGLSYNDSCLFHQGTILDTSRLNHFFSFDPQTGVVVCQGGVTFADLFLLDREFVPPVLPGTVHATLAGAIAHDVHGKNNHALGSFGHHIEWFDLHIRNKTFHCSQQENPDLFHATIGGLGLTGVILRIALRLRKAPLWVKKSTSAFFSYQQLLEDMQTQGIHHDYQVAWLDLFNHERALLTYGDHVHSTQLCPPSHTARYPIPKLPLRLIRPWNIKLLNQTYFHFAQGEQIQSLWTFNHPLDGVQHWNRLYGKKGFVQFQAVFPLGTALQTLKQLKQLIQVHQAHPTLSVLKLLTQSGRGMLSFTEPGFTLAIDFIYNAAAEQTIRAMNQWIADMDGKIYLAKDKWLTQPQFEMMYPNAARFKEIRKSYSEDMHSDLGQRLGLCL